MPSLPLLVALFVSDERKKHELIGENGEDQEVEQNDHRIDIPGKGDDTTINQRPSNEKNLSFIKRRRTDSLRAAGKVVKKPYTLSKRIAHALHQFIFVPDKHLEEGYSPKYRWWPIVSGVIVPFSILLEVPGLTEHWYVRTSGTQVVEYRPNPIILDVGLGFSMLSAILANLCLIMRFLERRIRSATILAICFLTIHDIINITTLAIFGLEHRFDDGFTYSQAYWVTFASTITSLTVTITLIIDYVRTPEFSKSGSGLTRKQRSLVIIVMILLAYLGFGALVYCFILHIPFLDALYFCVCSSLTIGFGDVTPVGTAAQVVSIFYNTFGILNTGLAIAIARETIVESFEQSYRSRRHALAIRRKAHRELHAKKHQAKHGLWMVGHKFNEHMPSEMELPVSENPPTPPPDMNEPSNADRALDQEEKEEARKEKPKEDREHEKGNDANGRPVPWRQLSELSGQDAPIEAAEEEREAVQEEEKGVDEAIQEQSDKTKQQVDKVDDNLVAGFDEEERNYIQFRHDMIREEKKEFKAKLWVSWGLFGIFWFVGGVIFMLSEKWSYGTAIYFCFTAFSTIGYGDIAPRTGPGRVCFIAWSLLGVGTMTILVSVLSEAYQSRYSTVMHNGLFDKAMRNYQNKTHSQKQSSAPNTPTYDRTTMTVEERRNALDETKVELSTIPPKIVAQAKIFHAHLQYVLSHNSAEKPPPGLQKALDEMMEEEEMDESLRKEVLDDGEAKRTLYLISFERAIKKMVESAERMSKLIDERNSLEAGLGLEKYVDEMEENEDEAREREEEEGAEDNDDENEEPRPPPLRAADSRQPPGKGHANWMKLRAGLLSSFGHKHSSRRGPYLHQDGSQSAPHLTKEAEEDQDGNQGGDVNKERGKEKDCGPGTSQLRPGNAATKWDEVLKNARARPPNAPSKLGAVRFADDPYGDFDDSREEGTKNDTNS